MPDIEITGEILQSLRSRILHEDDCAMFDDLAKIISAGANRSAYIMLWISCAESLKRRLKWAAEKDNQAGKLFGEVEKAEQQHHAVDARLISACNKIGVISDVEATHLSQIYENRNIYGHPYNLAPSKAGVLSALNVIIDSVFAKPNKLRHSYAIDRLNYLTRDETYLEDDPAKIEDYAKQVADRMDQGIHRYFLLRYFGEIQRIWKDPEQSIFKRRGMHFVKAFLEYVGVDSILAGDEWHDQMSKMPEFVSWLAAWPSIFQYLNDVSKDEAVLKNIELSKSNPKRLKRLYQLHAAGYLSESQSMRVRAKCGELSGHDLCESDVPLVFVIDDIIRRLDSGSYRTANGGASVLFWSKVDELPSIAEEHQMKVGDRLADAALMNAFDALAAVKRIACSEIDVPYPVKYGYCLHFFSKRVEDAITREPLCDNSLTVLCMLKEDDAQKIDNQLRETANTDKGFAAMMQSDMGKKFVQKYKNIKTPPF